DFPRAKEAAGHLLASKDLSEQDVEPVLSVLEAGNARDAAELRERLLEGLVDRQLASASTLQKLAALYESSDRLPRARETLEKVALLTGPSADLLLQLARVANKQGDHQGALGYLAHARDLRPEDAGTHFFFGMVCVELNLGAEAHRSLSRAVSLEPGNP